MKKKKSARRPPRRTTYETTHDHAATRLDKARQERTTALLKLDELAREIPYLENIVAATKPLEQAVNQIPSPPTPAYTPPPIDPTVETMDQEEFLLKYIPRTGRVTTTTPKETRPQPDGSSPDPDEFLSDGGGQEILS